MKEENILIDKLRFQLFQKQAQINDLETEIALVYTSKSWRLTKPLRFAGKIIRSVKKTLIQRKDSRHGVTKRMQRAWQRRYEFLLDYKAFGLKEGFYKKQCNSVFRQDIKFSIFVPLYNTPKEFLQEMIASVLFQTYSNWELCLADGSDSEHDYVCTVCMEIAAKDKRIKYKRLEKNNGISENTNACIEMATGDYFSLFDHDDLLHPSALYETMKAVCEQNADFIYSDEAVFESPDLHKINMLHLKPDFAPDTLLSNNYICHFTSFSKKLFEEVGSRFNSLYDGAQDYDVVLRLTEKAKKIVHIKKILYYWRSHPQSTAQSLSSKSYAAENGRKCIRDFLRHKGINVFVDNSWVGKTIYRIHYPIIQNDKVSIIIQNKTDVETLRRCIISIIEKTAYTNYEILIVNCTSISDKSYYDELKEFEKIKIYKWEKHGKDSISKILNLAALNCDGKYLVLLEDTIEIIEPGWLEEMLMFAQREDVGAVGAMLLNSDKTIQHAGIILDKKSDELFTFLFKNIPSGKICYMGRNGFVQNMTAVSSSCIMVDRKKYNAVGGFDESFSSLYCSIDFCLRLRMQGLLNIWTPFSKSYNHMQKDLRKLYKEQLLRKTEKYIFFNKWQRFLSDGDPYYNPHFFTRNGCCQPSITAFCSGTE